MRQTISEYMKQYNITKEHLQQKLKSKELDYIVEDGIAYIKTENPKDKTTLEMILSIYQKENLQLKLKIKELESKIDKLIGDKEQMLIAERERIEDIYIAKDEQLKSILEVFNTKLLLSNEQKVHDVDIETPQPALIELKRYLKFIGLSSQERKDVRRRFEAGFGSDPRIIERDGEFFVDLSRYDYSDFLSL